MSREIERQLATLQQGDHLCLIYENPAEQMAAVVPFIRQGLLRGERCVYIVDDRTAEEVVAALAAGGVDVARERERGALLLLTKREAYLRSGEFDPESMIAFLRQAVAEALSAGFTGLRVTGEMTWALGPEIGCDRLIEYEALLNHFFPGSRALAICQYNRRRFPPAIIQDVLRTHPVAILGEEVCPNLYYESPEMVLAREPDRARVDWMIDQLRRARETERALRTRARQRATLARLSQRALVSVDLQELLDEAVALVAEALDVEYSKVLELLPGEDALLLRSGIGWQDGLVGHATVGSGTDSQAGYTLLSDEPVIVEDLRTEPRFCGPPLLRDHSVVSGMSVVILGSGRPFGVLGAHTTRYRAFTKDDVVFLRSVAAILASAISRHQAEEEIRKLNQDLERRVAERTSELEASKQALESQVAERRRVEEALRLSEEQLRLITDALPTPISYVDREQRYRFNNRAYEVWFGHPRQELRGKHVREILGELAYEALRGHVEATLSGEQVVYEGLVPYEDGHARYISATYIPDRGDEGEVKGFIALINDISTSKQAEETLRQTRDYLEKLFDHANAPIIVWDPGFRITRFNQAFEHLTGYRAEEVLGQELSTLFPEASRAESLAKIQRTLQGEHWEAVEIPILRKDGDVRLALWNSANVYAQDGQTLVATIAQGQDITERQQAEERLRASEERYRLLVEGARDYAIYMLDPEGRVASWSAGAERIKGYRAEEILGQPFSLFFTEEDVQQRKPERELAMAAAEGRFEDEGWRVRKDGSRFWANVVVTPLRYDDGRLHGFSKVTRDMTERRRVEEQLRKLSRAVEQSPATVVITDTDGRIEYVNPKFSQSTGYTSEEALGQNPRILKSGHTQPEEYERLWKTIAAGGEWRGEFHNRRKDGELYWEAASISPIRSPEGTITHFLAVKEDITERKEAEEKIRRLNADLMRQAAELRASNAELESFAYSVSHDLRAPLRGIDGFSQALMEDYADRLDDEGMGYLHRVRAASQRMGQLIDDILALSRVSRSETHRGPLDLSSLARAVALELQSRQPERQVEFVIAPDLVAEGDERLLRVVMENLLGNAWKFTAKHARARIEFGMAKSEGGPAYYVRDDGAGFDMAYGDKLFGPFQRLHSESEFGGTGIGLATVQRIVRRHGGRVWAEGEVERGATFYFTL